MIDYMDCDTTHFSVLRRRNKERLVERAFAILVPREYNTSDLKEQWIEGLIAGYCVETFIRDLKGGKFLAEQAPAHERIPNKQIVGEIRVIDENLTLYAGLKRKLMVCVHNYSNQIFQTTPEEPLFVAYHWYRDNGEVYDFDGVRTQLDSPVAPAHRIEMPMTLVPPAEPGEYELMVSMVYEGRCWMEDVGLRAYRLKTLVHDYDGRGLSRHALSVLKQLRVAEAGVGN